MLSLKIYLVNNHKLLIVELANCPPNALLSHDQLSVFICFAFDYGIQGRTKLSRKFI